MNVSDQIITIHLLYEQQKSMYDNKTHSVGDRIVNIIKKGKEDQRFIFGFDKNDKVVFMLTMEGPFLKCFWNYWMRSDCNNQAKNRKNYTKNECKTQKTYNK